MLTTKEVRSVQVCHAHKPGHEVDKNGVPRRHRKIGKVFKTVFSPDGLRVVGFIVQRPDLLWMIKRPDMFLALDAMDVQDGVIVATKGSKSWDEEALKRLGVDWDTCIIWEGMEVKTTKGFVIGHVDELSFDETTGELNSLFLNDGMSARALLGSIEIPRELMVGYKKGVLIVQPEAANLLPSGGLAAKAGTATAKVQAQAGAAQQAAVDAADKAIEVGTTGIGKGVGRIKRSVTGAVDEFKKESAAPKKATSSKSASGAKKSSSNGASSKKSPSSSSSAAKAASKHMKGVGSMFSDFKKEFDKASK